MRTVLVDADPLGGGIDLAVGIDGDAAARRPPHAWPTSWLPMGMRAEPHPPTGDLTVFSWSRGSGAVIPPTAVTAVMTTVRSSADLICVDLPRALDATGSAAAQLCQTVLIVVPAEVRAAAAAVRVRERAQQMCDDVRAVVRVPGPGGLAAEVVAQAVGVPLYGVLRRESGLAQALERGEPPGSRRRGPLARFSTRFVASLPSEQAYGAEFAA
jgi:secretion/DNA translocation related CpaE-like protein